MITNLKRVQFSDSYLRMNRVMKKQNRVGTVVGFNYNGTFVKVLWDGNVTPVSYHVENLRVADIEENRYNSFSFPTYKDPATLTSDDYDYLSDWLKRLKEYQKYLGIVSMKQAERRWQMIQTTKEIERLEIVLMVNEQVA
ncbi:MAG: hypothetical protein K0S44_189 [Bacteroidetes bacterium]|jgi:hypothetical protein|nr:hypothetical protein [Bacteroidota bacterium]